MKKIPYGIIDYKSLILEDYIYVDKTPYLEKLENIQKTLFYLRPGRFGKSLFTSMMFYYYDIKSADKFDALFKDTYIGKNPTENKNNYYVLTFDFSGISTDEQLDKNDLMESFKASVKMGIDTFVKYYGFEYEIDESAKPDNLLKDFLTYINGLNLDNKMYIIIDEYDNFTNAILEGDGKDFIDIVGNNGFVKSFYSNIKIFVKMGLVDRFFATGICPITLNSMTTGFNIATDISTDLRFNSMIGLTHEETIKLLDVYTPKDKDKIYDIMLKHYDGYLFSQKLDSNNRVFNATLVMYFLKYYVDFNALPEILYDNNINVNYGKIESLIKLQNNNFYKEILDTLLSKGEIEGRLNTSYNLLDKFNKADVISLLYYFGYLTISGEALLGETRFAVPNEAMRQAYGSFFVKLLSDIDVVLDNERIKDAIREMMEFGKVDKLTYYISELLHQVDSLFFTHFKESNIQEFYYVLLLNSREFRSQIDYPCIGGGKVDVFLESINPLSKYNIMIELKYLPDNEKNNVVKIQNELEDAKNQLKSRKIYEDNVKKYAIVFVGRDVSKFEEVD